jgi:hypothetical protein
MQLVRKNSTNAQISDIAARKSTSLITTSHHNKLRSAEHGATSLCKYNQAYSNKIKHFECIFDVIIPYAKCIFKFLPVEGSNTKYYSSFYFCPYYPARKSNILSAILCLDFNGLFLPACILLNYLANGTIFLDEMFYMKYDFLFSLQYLSEIFLQPGGIQRNIVIKALRSSCKVIDVFVGF